jgi:uncharacterized membrane protein
MISPDQTQGYPRYPPTWLTPEVDTLQSAMHEKRCATSVPFSSSSRSGRMASSFTSFGWFTGLVEMLHTCALRRGGGRGRSNHYPGHLEHSEHLRVNALLLFMIIIIILIIILLIIIIIIASSRFRPATHRHEHEAQDLGVGALEQPDQTRKRACAATRHHNNNHPSRTWFCIEITRAPPSLSLRIQPHA